MIDHKVRHGVRPLSVDSLVDIANHHVRKTGREGKLTASHVASRWKLHLSCWYLGEGMMQCRMWA